MTDSSLLARVIVDPKVCRGRPYIRGTGIYIAIILDALFEGFTPEQVIDHYPSLVLDDIRAAVAYATTLAEENRGVAVINDQSHRAAEPQPKLGISRAKTPRPQRSENNGE
ncbi:MAG: DUF433 domain-containing protein [Deltaproteobacteria bacterium]|nr:DUF433 domain-containing protein [Deltaproteobacteria bacterium]